MCKYILSILFLTSLNSFGQSVIGSNNSGAHSGSDFMFSVGEIFVEPETNGDDANSGLLGILYQVELNVTGVETILESNDFRAYPNPTNQTLYFNIETQHKLEQIYIYDSNGILVHSLEPTVRKVDLSHLPEGVYFIHTNIENIAPLKFVKL